MNKPVVWYLRTHGEDLRRWQALIAVHPGPHNPISVQLWAAMHCGMQFGCCCWAGGQSSQGRLVYVRRLWPGCDSLSCSKHSQRLWLLPLTPVSGQSWSTTAKTAEHRSLTNHGDTERERILSELSIARWWDRRSACQHACLHAMFVFAYIVSVLIQKLIECLSQRQQMILQHRSKPQSQVHNQSNSHLTTNQLLQ